MRLPNIKEAKQEAYRYQIEGEQVLDLYNREPFWHLRENAIHILNLMVVPPADWKPCGHVGELVLLFGDRPMYRAPVEILMAEWQRYQIGAPQLFRSLVVPVKQGILMRVEGTMLPTLVDMLLYYKRDVV